MRGQDVIVLGHLAEPTGRAPPLSAQATSRPWSGMPSRGSGYVPTRLHALRSSASSSAVQSSMRHRRSCRRFAGRPAEAPAAQSWFQAGGAITADSADPSLIAGSFCLQALESTGLRTASSGVSRSGRALAHGREFLEGFPIFAAPTRTASRGSCQRAALTQRSCWCTSIRVLCCWITSPGASFACQLRRSSDHDRR